MTIRTVEARRFERTGMLAIDPKAFLELFIPPAAEIGNEEIGDVTVVDVSGPLTQRDEGWWGDSYEAITRRVRVACASKCKAIVMRIDSPGGDAQGCFETARELRAMCAAAGKPLYAWVGGRACSAAYALATAAGYIGAAQTATLGSIGVLSTRVDYSAQNAAMGIRVAFVASGARKADGHPDAPITDAELASEQSLVDGLAAVFFGLVAEHRGVPTKAIEQLDARVLLGASAVSAGLANGVCTFQTMLAQIAAGGLEKTMTKYEEALAALTALAEGDDPNSKAAAAALAALQAANGGDDDKDPDKSAESDEPDKDDEDKPKPDAAEPDEKDKPAARVARAARTPAPVTDLVAMASKIHALEAREAEREEREERAKLVASRPDFGPEMLAICKSSPIETVRDLVAKLPKGKPIARTGKAAAAAQSDVRPTLGADQGDGDGVEHLAPELKLRMDKQMGLVSSTPQAINEPYKMTFGPPPVKAPATVKGGN